MNHDVTELLSARGQGDPHAASRLLPLVYDELRQLAAQRLAQEQPGQTLQPTALVHEAYPRLVGLGDPGWENRGHFFAAGDLGSARHRGRDPFRRVAFQTAIVSPVMLVRSTAGRCPPG